MISRARLLTAVLCLLLLSVGAPASLAQAKPPKPPKPVVTKVTPATGPVAGGTTVKIKGSHLTGATKVLFGTAKGTQIKVKSDKKLTVVAPAHAAGTVVVRVKTKGGKSAATGPAFTYVAKPPAAQPPTVTGLTPATGPASGGSVVVVSGTNLTGATAVTFGGTPGTGLTPGSSTSLTVTSPAHAAGIVDVRVTTAKGTSAVVAADKFTYSSTPPPADGTAPLPVNAGTNPDVTLDGTACPATNHCFAVGSYLTDESLRLPLVIEVSGDSSQTPSSPALPIDVAAFDRRAMLYDIACPSATYCVAVGEYRTNNASGNKISGLVETWNGSTWAATAVPLPANADNGSSQTKVFRSVACFSATTCAAVGSYAPQSGVREPFVAAWNGSAWTGAKAPIPATYVYGDLFDVACPAEGTCTAVGGYHATGAGSPSVPHVVDLASGSWTLGTGNAGVPNDSKTVPSSGLVAISCPTAATCVAVGEYARNDASFTRSPFVLSRVSSVPTYFSAPPPVDASVIGMGDIVCTSATSCTAAGYFLAGSSDRALKVTFNGVAASAAEVSLAGPHTDASTRVRAIACVTTCLGVGSYIRAVNNTTGWSGLLLHLGASPTGDAIDAPTGANDVQLNDVAVSHAGDERSLVVGTYDDASLHSQGLLLLGVAT